MRWVGKKVDQLVGSWVWHWVAQTVVLMADNWVQMTVVKWVVAKAAS